MAPLGISAYRLALLLHTTNQQVYEILNGRRRITAQTALRLAKCFGTTPQFWMSAQMEYELEQAEERWGRQIDAEVTSLQVTVGNTPIKTVYEQQILDTLTDKEKNVYNIIVSSDKPISFDDLMDKVEMPIGELSATLTIFELDGLIIRVPGDSYVKGRPKLTSLIP
jgi:addiction module HigA family antidote